MTREEAIELVELAFDAWEHQYSTGDDWSKEHEAKDMAIKALEQESILNKIRAEIDTARFIDKDTKLCKNANASGLEVAMQIIDKYKAESEPQESEG